MDVKRKDKAGTTIRSFGVGLFILLSAIGYGQAKFTTNVDQSTITRDQLVQVEYLVENAKKVDDFDPPSFRNFLIIQGPIETSRMAFVNGALTQYTALIFILQPRTTGKLIIPGASAIIDGKRRQSDAVALEVTRSARSGGTSQRRRMIIGQRGIEADKEFVLYPDEDPVEKIRKNLFVRVEVNRRSCFVNEPVVATYKLYSRLRSESRVVKRPSYNGFSVYDMPESDPNSPVVETIDGREYNVHVIRRSQLFPLQAGDFVLEPVEVENTVHFLKAETEQDTYLEEIDEPFAETVQHTVTVGSNPVKISVKQLPTAGLPSGYDGAVGNFSITASLKDPIVKAGESASLVVEVKGKGNIPMINAPAMKWPREFEVYEPNTKEEVHPENAPLAGIKTFAYPFTLKDTGNVVIPPVRFSFFDPATKTYKTDSTREISIRVLPASRKIIPDEDRKTVPDVFSPVSNERIWMIIGAGLVTLLIVSFIIIRNKKTSPSSGSRPAKPTVATEVEETVAIKPDPLEKARRMLSAATAGSFVKEVEAVVWEQVAEKLQIEPAALNQPQVISSLEKMGADESTVRLFKQVMSECAYALYIPGQTSDDLEVILQNASGFLDKLNAL